MAVYYPRLDHAVPDCSGLSMYAYGGGGMRHDYSKTDKKSFAKFERLKPVSPGINALKKRLDEMTEMLAEIADGYTDSNTGGYDWW